MKEVSIVERCVCSSKCNTVYGVYYRRFQHRQVHRVLFSRNLRNRMNVLNKVQLELFKM